MYNRRVSEKGRGQILDDDDSDVDEEDGWKYASFCVYVVHCRPTFIWTCFSVLYC